MVQVKKLDNMLDEFPILRAYLYYTAFYTFAGTVGGAAFGALLGAHDFIMQVDDTIQMSDAFMQYRTGDIKEPILSISKIPPVSSTQFPVN